MLYNFEDLETDIEDFDNGVSWDWFDFGWNRQEKSDVSKKTPPFFLNREKPPLFFVKY